MVSDNLQGIANEFEGMVEERDMKGFIALAGVGAIGGVLAEMFHDRIAPRLGQSTDPSGAQGLGISFVIKSFAAVLLVMGAIRTGGSMALLMGAAAIGAAVDAGVDLVDAGDTLRSGATAQQLTGSSSDTSSPSKSSSGTSRQRAKPARSSGQTSTFSRSRQGRSQNSTGMRTSA